MLDWHRWRGLRMAKAGNIVAVGLYNDKVSINFLLALDNFHNPY